jgi:ElaB/YqjD/DUF883 family membrane-anchored ribosome-binding protein
MTQSATTNETQKNLQPRQIDKDITLMSNYTEEVRRDVNALAKDARALVVATGHLAEEKVTAARQRLSVALENAQDICGRMQQKAVGKVKAADQVVRDHPYQVAGIALGIGVLIGLLITRRKTSRSNNDGRPESAPEQIAL